MYTGGKMKIRNGFVSNSSSSSFVAVCPADKDWMSQIEGSKEYKYIFEDAFTPLPQILDGKEVTMFIGMREDDWGTVEDSSAYRAMASLYDWDEDAGTFVTQADEFYDKFFEAIENSGGFVYKSGRW
jgi:hypothetical protein